MNLKSAATIVATGALLLVGCTAPSPDESSSASQDQEQTPRELTTAVTRPTEELTVIATGDAADLAVATSGALFTTSPAALVAPTGDLSAQMLAAEGAVALGVPLLLAPAEPSGEESSQSESGAGTPTASAEPATPAPLGAELDRLGVEAVVIVGDARLPADAGDGIDVVATQASAPALSDAIGITIDDPATDEPGDFPARIADTTPGGDRPASQSPTSDSESSTAPDSEIPTVLRDDPPEGTAAVAIDDPDSLAGLATIRAAGVEVALLDADDANPQASSDAIDLLTGTDAVLALGAAFADETDLAWKVRSTQSGYQLPGGGQVPFGSHQFIALYGSPGIPELGVLGKQDLDASIDRVEALAEEYRPLSDKTVVPMFEIITTVASAHAGPDGNYSTELDPADLRPWIDRAAEEGISVVLDLQPGRTHFLAQAQQYEELLRLPNVGLALDPEWRLKSDQVHLRQIGSVSVSEINEVTAWLAELVDEDDLPPKMLVLHQFRLSMITGRSDLDTSRPQVAVLIHADGQGGQGAKQDTWRALHKDAPTGIGWGWKNFYEKDSPMLTPEQTMDQVDPTPDLVSYQ